MSKLRPKYLKPISLTRRAAIDIIGRRYPVLSFHGLNVATDEQLADMCRQIATDRLAAGTISNAKQLLGKRAR